MATPLEALQNRSKLLSSNLDSSSTAYQPNTFPTGKDLSTDKQLSSVNKQIDDLRSKNLRNTWYGPSDTSTEDGGGENDGLIISGLKALQKPLNAVAGTAQYLLGKGNKPSLGANINEATKTGLTFGNILQQSGASRAVQIPLGFALDVMFDPVNWLTAGTEALIPRAATGLIKGGYEGGLEGAVKGLSTGITSNLERKAAATMGIVPFVQKIAKLAPAIEETGIKTGGLTGLLGRGAEKYSSIAEKLGQKAITGAENFDKITGTTLVDRLNKTGFGFKGGTIGDTAEQIVRKIPSTSILGKTTPTGDQIVDFFKYSPRNAADIADLKDKVINLAKNKGIILTRNQGIANFENIDDFLKPGATIKLPDKLGETMDIAIRDADGVLKPDYANKVKVYDSMENAQSLLESAGEDYNLKNLTQAYKKTPIGKTGVQWYDNVIDKLKSTSLDDIFHGRLGTPETEAIKTEADELVKTWNSYNTYKDLKPLNKLLEAQQGFISLFKSAKVPMNVASHVVANIGNFFMGTMMGLPMWKPEYLKAMTEANLLVKGRLGANGFKEMFFSDIDSLINMADNNPTRFKQLTGMDPSEVANKLTIEQKVSNVINENTTKNELLNILKKAADQAVETEAKVGELSKLENIANEAADLEKASKINKSIIKEKMGSYPTPSEQLSKMLKESPNINRAEEFGSYTTSEITHNQRLQKIKDWVAKEAEIHKYNPAYRIANTIVNSMPKWYEHIDQSFKIGTQSYLTKVGLTEQELKTISRTIPIDGTKDLLRNPETGELITNIANGKKLYRLTQLKASEVATEAFMNYAAMPDFVRVMRALPIVGSPFLSFPYAMAIKTSKTLINNPAIFNKIGFMINEMNAARTPQEKAAMEEKYNQYLKSPTVAKVFGMWNTNVKNLIPYYQMNMFNPSERNYSNSSQGQIMKIMDKFPVMQDPVGAVIRDYFIQPWILSGSGDMAQGQFGEPLFPSFDEKGKPIKVGLGTKTLYGGRALAESMIPGALGYSGIINSSLDLSPNLINAVPSYGFRNLANATQGRSSIGATTKEDAIRKTLRSLLGRTGLPAYTLDTTKTSK